ncbi:Transposase, Mutator family [Falsiroseomonas stagni DSM 19981]|uniref:Transposase, Mutator family n=1 Tax=Falsiroseomonas stagni DSM 19981 TaxID=1123062 RepID=A0A1I4EHB5_9PROT|nr:Transposase, Mutator family [Falsiroseomonas stagni DSM 19981]
MSGAVAASSVMATTSVDQPGQLKAGFPPQHRTKPHSTNSLERLNKEVQRRADVVGIFPFEASIIRLTGGVLPEANDERQMQHRYMGVEAMGETLNPALTNETLQLPPKAA